MVDGVKENQAISKKKFMAYGDRSKWINSDNMTVYVGGKYRLKDSASCNYALRCSNDKAIIEIIAMGQTGSIQYRIKQSDGQYRLCSGCIKANELLPYHSAEDKFNNVLDTIRFYAKKKETRDMISAGLLTFDEKLTDDGRAVLEHILVKSHANQFAYYTKMLINLKK